MKTKNKLNINWNMACRYMLFIASIAFAQPIAALTPSPNVLLCPNPATDRCSCHQYSVTSSCDEQTGDVTFTIIYNGKYPACAAAEQINTVGLRIITQGYSESILLETNPLNIAQNTPYIITVPGDNGPLWLEMTTGKVTNYQHLFTHPAVCLANGIPSPSPTPYPTTWLPISCEIDGPSSEQCQGEITSLNYRGVFRKACGPVLHKQACDENQIPNYKWAKWTYNCVDSNGATVTSSSSDTGFTELDLQLLAPGQGKATSCKVLLEVSWGQHQPPAQCSIATDVTACSLDCNGTINGTGEFDKCGICGGDDTSCDPDTQCTSQNISNSQLLLDGSSRSMALSVNKIAALFRRVTNNSRRANRFMEQADQMHLQTWNKVWSVPSTILNCLNPGNQCTNVDFSSLINSLNSAGEEYKKMNDQLFKIILRRATKARIVQRARKLNRNFNNSYNNYFKDLKSLPLSHATCAP